MKRYDIGYSYCEGEEVAAHEDGEWVKWEDVDPILKKLNQYLQECMLDVEDRWITRETLHALMKNFLTN